MKQYGNELIDLFSLGDLYISDFIKEGDDPRGGRESLSLKLDPKTGLVRLSKVSENLYGKYWYRSGTNATMTKELGNIVISCMESIKTESGDIFLDIACNDGTLLKQVPSDMVKIGIDPCDDSYKNESVMHADEIIQDYFSAKSYKKCSHGDTKPKIITTIAMFYDLDDPLEFLRDINEIMDDEGMFVLQMSYTPLMLQQLAFDNICHEHIFYYTLGSLKYLLDKVDLNIIDCRLNDTNGGSFRLYIRKKKADVTKFRTSPFRDVANYRIQGILSMENQLNLCDPKTYIDFYDKITALKNQTVDFIKSERTKGKTIWGYGASTKGNTLLQWFGLDETDIIGIAERSPYKYGLKTIGTNIPIYSEDEMRKANPDYLLVLPWHFINEFKEREKDYLNAGGKFILPCPQFEIIGS